MAFLLLLLFCFLLTLFLYSFSPPPPLLSLSLSISVCASPRGGANIDLTSVSPRRWFARIPSYLHGWVEPICGLFATYFTQQEQVSYSQEIRRYLLFCNITVVILLIIYKNMIINYNWNNLVEYNKKIIFSDRKGNKIRRKENREMVIFLEYVRS